MCLSLLEVKGLNINNDCTGGWIHPYTVHILSGLFLSEA